MQLFLILDMCVLQMGLQTLWPAVSLQFDVKRWQTAESSGIAMWMLHDHPRVTWLHQPQVCSAHATHWPQSCHWFSGLYLTNRRPRDDLLDKAQLLITHGANPCLVKQYLHSHGARVTSHDVYNLRRKMSFRGIYCTYVVCKVMNSVAVAGKQKICILYIDTKCSSSTASRLATRNSL